MHFQYQAKNNKGKLLAGVIEADTLAEARRELRSQGMFVLQVADDTRKALSFDLKRWKKSFTPKRRVSKTDLLLFTTQLSVMCRAGIDLAEALQNVSQQCPNKALKLTLEEVYQDVADGKAISDAMGRHIDVFGEAYVSTVSAGESSGTLQNGFARLSEMLRNEIRLRSTIRSILSYPAVLIGVATLVVFSLVFFVLPQFAKVFADMGKPAPPLTQFILDFGQGFRNHFVLISGGTAVFLGALYKFWFSRNALSYFDRFLLNGPVIRNATRSLYTGRAFSLLGTMLKSDIPLLEALRLSRSSVKNHLYKNLFNRLEEDVLNGKGLGKALSEVDFIPPGASQMVITAERTGKLGDVMMTIGEFYEEEGEQRIRQLAKILEPLIILIMGAVVAVVMLSIMIPLLDVSTASH
ncbi:MAG: type II secretion system F family protein [Planctomycetaceae bacterium]